MILVTGATGTTGSEIVRQLAAAGARVRALVHRRPAAAAVGGHVEYVTGDLADAASVERAMAGVERVMLIPPVDPRAAEMQRNVAAAAKRAGVRHIAKLSVLAVNPNSPVRFLRWHAEGERIVADSGIPATNLRANSFMQNILHMAPQIAATGVFYQPAGNARISFVDARDIGAAATRVLTEDGHGGRSYDITGPEALTFADAAAAIAEAAGRPVQYREQSPEEFKQTILGFGRPEWVADGLNELYGFYREGLASRVDGAVEKLAGRRATTFREFARDYAPAFSGNAAASGGKAS